MESPPAFFRTLPVVRPVFSIIHHLPRQRKQSRADVYAWGRLPVFSGFFSCISILSSYKDSMAH
jgi:hypothetical protein